MPLVRCPQCGQTYDIPPGVAVRLPTSVANCSCGYWLCGSREGLLKNLSESGRIEEINVEPYKVEAQTNAKVQLELDESAPTRPRSVRIIARGADESINTVFTIHEHPLWIGRRACHIEFDDAELSIQHCSIEVRGEKLVVRDADSYTGTFLDGEPVNEAEIGDGVHLLRVGHALLSIEPVDAPGRPVEPVQTAAAELFNVPQQLVKRRPASGEEAPKKLVLRCVEGPLAGKEFDLDPKGMTVGREGSLRVPDEYLSRKHFQIFSDENGVLRIQDLGSRNGTFLNTLPAKNTKVQAGDEIKAGMTTFKVELR
jgi:pSer/pThr/pTyr-binding forkhead associated (FHA) protein